MRKALILATIVGLAAALMPTSRAQDASFDCGDVIKESIRLNNSLANCHEDGLVVGANGITIDLGGETIDGDGGQGAGIVNEKGYKDVTITGGTITGFEHGVLIESPQRTENVIDDLALSANETAIFVDGADANEITDNELIGNEAGIEVVGTENVIEDNEIFDELPAISVDGNDNSIIKNEIDYPVAGPDDSDAAIAVEGDDNVLEKNDVLAGEGGISVDGDDNVIETNDLEGGAGHGIAFEGRSNRVIDNDVKAYDDIGILLRDGSGNLIADNKVEEGADEGILVRSDETRIESNDVDENGDDGIRVDADDARIVGNKVTDNGFDDGGYGILADGEGIEGSDNRARGNANATQCDPAVICD